MPTYLGLKGQYQRGSDRLPDEVLDGIESIEGLKLSDIIARGEDGPGAPTDSDRLELEFKRFLALVLMGLHGIVPEESVGPTVPIDTAWHSFLVHTHRYTDFCDDVMGGYVHHVPATPRASGDEMRNLLQTYFEGCDLEGLWAGDLYKCWPEIDTAAGAR